MRTSAILPTTERSEERRDQPRHSVLFRTVLIDSEIEGEAVEIVNIARLGFLARTAMQREKGSRIRLDMPVLGQLDADIVWCGNGLLGGRFSKAVNETAFSRLLQSLA